MTEPRPHRAGDVVRDISQEQVGEIIADESAHLRLRPLGGGRIWEADPDHLRPIDRDEVLHAHLAAVNARSRRAADLPRIWPLAPPLENDCAG